VGAEHRVVSGVAAGVILLVAVLVPILALSWCNRRGWLRVAASHHARLASYRCLRLPLVGRCAIRRPITMEELSPSLPGDAATFQTFLRLWQRHPAAAAVKAAPIQQIVAAGTAHIVSNPEKMGAGPARTSRRDRGRMGGARARARLVGRTRRAPAHRRSHSADPVGPIIAFQPVRYYCQFAVAIASLQALDGHGDEAMATLARLYEVGRKFEPNSRTLVRFDDRQNRPENGAADGRLRPRPRPGLAASRAALAAKFRRPPQVPPARAASF